MEIQRNTIIHCAFLLFLAAGIAVVPSTSAWAFVPIGGGGGSGGGGGGSGGGGSGGGGGGSGGGGGGTSNDPGPVAGSGPGLPYIAGRLGGPRQAPSSAPAGTVVPDDFCLPGKLDDCGSHLRGGAVIQEQGPIFVGNEDSDFFQARHSVWANADFRRTSLNNSETRELSAYTVGIDRRFGNNVVFGIMVVSSNSRVDNAISGIQDRASGFAAGPYFGIGLSDNLFLDARYYLGTTSHDVLTGGTTTGRYDSQDSFASVRISAEVNRGNWDIFPSVEFAQIRQSSDAYTDSTRGAVAASLATQEYVTLAALGYYNGLVGFTPYLGLEVSHQLGASGVSGALRTGGTINFDSGARLNIDYAFGGIGLADVDDHQISIRFEIPF